VAEQEAEVDAEDGMDRAFHYVVTEAQSGKTCVYRSYQLTKTDVGEAYVYAISTKPLPTDA
jgi:hypothetical protein